MLQDYDINCKTVTILFYLLITQLTVYNRTITRLIQTIRLFISEWDERCDWLQTTAERTTSFEAFELEITVNYPVYLNREWQFHAKSHELIGVFFVCPPDWAQGPPLLRDERGLTLPGYRTIYYCTRLEDFLKQTVDASNFPAIVRKFTQRPSCITPFWQIEILNQNIIFLSNLYDFV